MRVRASQGVNGRRFAPAGNPRQAVNPSTRIRKMRAGHRVDWNVPKFYESVSPRGISLSRRIKRPSHSFFTISKIALLYDPGLSECQECVNIVTERCQISCEGNCHRITLRGGEQGQQNSTQSPRRLNTSSRNQEIGIAITKPEMTGRLQGALKGQWV